MNLYKPWYTSKTIWGSVVAISGAALSMFGINLDEQSQSELVDATLQIVTICGSLFAVVGRVNANSLIE